MLQYFKKKELDSGDWVVGIALDSATAKSPEMHFLAIHGWLQNLVAEESFRVWFRIVVWKSIHDLFCSDVYFARWMDFVWRSRKLNAFWDDQV